jgi:phosphatidylserine decarboxylase
MFSKYGYDTLSISLVIIFIIIGASFFIKNAAVRNTLIIAAILLLALTLNFFRDPERTTPKKEGIVVSPADGKVLLIKEVTENKFIGGKGTQISIFMSPLNVHVNRIPISGTVKYLKYVPGKFLTAFNDKADQENERYEIGIESEYGKVFFTQVAGFVARRIVNSLKEGDIVEIGKRFGMIKFGSRVDVIIPSGAKINVKKDDKVTAGKTILFELNK